MTTSDQKKRLQCLIKQNHKILTTGCGSRKCRTIKCVSSGKSERLDPDTAFKEAFHMASKSKDTAPDVLSSHVIFSLMKTGTEPFLDMLKPILTNVISDPYKLSKSFTQAGTDNVQQIVTIDKDEVEEAYECLFSVENEDLEAAICDSFGSMVTTLATLIKEKPKEVKYLINCIIIFLLHPKLQNPEYAQGPFADLCGCLAVIRRDFKINIIHYISTLPPDTIRSMIYNFQQVIAIGIALRDDDLAPLNKEKPVCDGVLGLQLLYGAVIYRAQHTIPQFLGDLSLSKQVSQDVTTPVTPYTNPMIKSINGTSTPDAIQSPSTTFQTNIDSSATPTELLQNSPISKEPEKDNIIQIPNSDNNNKPLIDSDAQQSSSNEQQSDSNVPVSENGVQENGSMFNNTDPADENTDENETNERSEDEEPTDSIRSASDLLLPLLMAGELQELNDEEDSEDLPVENVRNFLDQLEAAAADEDSSGSDVDQVDALSNLLNMRFGLFGGGRGGGRSTKKKENKLFKKLGIDPLWDSHTDLDLSIFYNDNISDDIKIDEDYINYKTGKGFSFLRYPFILKPQIKSVGLQFDNRINMSRLANPFQLLMSGGFPYLKLVVKRERIIEDALTHLEMVAEEDPGQLQRQLYVEFEGEEGVDEGGVQKEFFQLIIAELFKPDYGMYVEIEDTRMLWFNSESFELEHNYKLIGMLLGLAVYNNVILDVRFPTVLYQKLMGEKTDIRDLIQSHPLLGSSLQQLLDYPDSDVQDVFLLDFVVSTTGLFGNTITHELRENGANIPVTNDNRHEFVNEYVDYVINQSTSKQFEQFKKGFDMVTANSQLKEWFRPEELEKVIVGTRELDFRALQGVTRYDGGYSKDTKIIIWFWEVVHNMTDEDQCKLLTFSTGCGRAPVGGMGEMNFVIVKNGDDSERLPTAHTCFNVLLLPEYSSKDKLSQKLYKSIQHFEGFGMI